MKVPKNKANNKKALKITSDMLALIRKARKAHNYTQEKVAGWIGVERSTYVRKEAGSIPLTVYELMIILLELDLWTDFIDRVKTINVKHILNCLHEIDKAVSSARLEAGKTKVWK